MISCENWIQKLFYHTFLKQKLCKIRNFSLKLEKFGGGGAWNLKRLWIRHDNCNISCRYWVVISTSHAIVYWLNALDLS